MDGLGAFLLLSACALTFCSVLFLVRLALRCGRSSAQDALLRIRAHAERALRAALESPLLAGWVRRARERRRALELRRAMPEALRLLCMALDSGSSLVKALAYAADNCDEPLASELKHVVWDLEAGHGFDEAMESLRSRTGGSEFAYLAVAMEIQHASGGSLSDVLASVSTALRQSADLEEELKTKTAQARLSARVVSLMPAIALVLLSLFSEGYYSTLLSSPLGVAMLLLALLLECAGVLLVRRALQVDLSAQMEVRAA